MKHGKWVTFHDKYNYNCQVLDVGQYHHGIKEGKWKVKKFQFNERDVSIYNWPQNKFYIIGGGKYHNGQKYGQWIDLEESYNQCFLILYEGQYKNGLKHGKWQIIKYNNYDQQKNIIFINKISCDCIYDKDGFKNLQWIELNNNNLQLVDYEKNNQNKKKNRLVEI